MPLGPSVDPADAGEGPEYEDRRVWPPVTLPVALLCDVVALLADDDGGDERGALPQSSCTLCRLRVPLGQA